MALDEEQVIVASKEYDLECVQWLSVAGMDLRDVCVLSQCPNLVELDISNNRIFSLRGLEGHATLRVLNAAHNKVSDLSKLEGCVKLEKLLLQGNEVMSLDSLPADLPCLRQLTLRVVPGKGSRGGGGGGGGGDSDEASNPLYEEPQCTNPAEAEAELLAVVAKRWPTVFLFNGGHTTFAKSAAEVLLDLAGPPPAVDGAGGAAGDQGDWLAGFEWGEYFDPDTFPVTYRPVEQEVEATIADIKQLDAAADALLSAAKSGAGAAD